MSISELLQAYADLVAEWAPKLDLVSPGDLPRFYERHIEDSLKALPVISGFPPGPAVDVGSGAGLPGLPLAISDPARHWRLLEPRKRRAAFLEEAVRTLGLDSEVLVMSAEQAAADPALSSAHMVGTARALASPEAAAELIAPLLAPGGRAIVWVGAGTPDSHDGLLIRP